MKSFKRVKFSIDYFNRMKVFIVSFVLVVLIGMSSPVLAQWQIEVIDPGSWGGYVSQALDSQGNPHLAYCDSGQGIVKYARWDGSSWQIEVVDNSGNVGDYLSFTLDEDDNAHISYYKNLGTNDGNLMYAHWDGTAWNIETVDSGQDTGTDTSIDTDSNGYPHISYADNYNAILKYASWDGSAWNLEVVDNGDHVGFYSSLALGKDDNAHICYRDNAIGILRYARWDGSEWQLEIVDNDAAERVGAFGSIKLDEIGNPHISYYDWPDKLRYASWDGASWNIEHVGLGGRGTSLVLDNNGTPHISHSDYTTTSVRYSFWDGISWQTETVDGASSNVGYATSLVLDDYSTPFIAYQDLTNFDLKYAGLGGVGINNHTDVPEKGIVLGQNFPNPTNNQTNIQVSFSDENLINKSKKLILFDSKGDKVYSWDFSSFRVLNSPYSITVETNDLNSGVYFYSLFIDNKLVERKSMLVVK